MKDSPPQGAPKKANGSATTKPRRPASGNRRSKGSKRSSSPKKRQVTSPSKVAKPVLKAKTLHQSPSSRQYPEMSEHERKMAESDAYLRKLNAKSAKSRPGLVLVQKREKQAQFEKDHELS